MENKCLLAAMLFYVGLCICANTEDFENASREISRQEASRAQALLGQMVATVRELLANSGSRRIFTDPQIRAALNRAHQADISAENLTKTEADLLPYLGRYYPGRIFSAEEIREIALRGIRTQEAARLLTLENHN